MKGIHRAPVIGAPIVARCLGLLALLSLASLATQNLWGQAPQPATAPLIVDEVFIHGLRTVPADQIKAILRTQRGREFNPSVLQEDFNRLATSLLVRPLQVKDQLTADGHITIHIIVEEFPTIVQEVVYKNAHHLRTEELEDITRIKKGMPLNPGSNQKACFALQEHYKKLGRIFTSVKLDEGGKAGDRRVVFNVTESDVVRVRSMRYEGNAELATGGRLATQVDSHGAYFGMLLLGSNFNPIILENDMLKLQEYYKNNGYLDARVSRDLSFSDDLKSVDVVFHVYEGTRYRVQEVLVEGTKILEHDQVASIVQSKKGELYSQFTVESDARNITDLYGWRGYKVIVDKKTSRPANLEPGFVKVHYQVAEFGPAKVSTITIVGNEVTKQNVILRVLQLYPGQTLSYPLIRQAENDLKRTGLFKVNQETGEQPTITVGESDNEWKPLTVSITEMATGSIMFGAGVNSNAGLVGSIVLNEKNFDIFRPPTSVNDLFSGKAWRGGGQEFRAEAVPGTQLQRYSVSFREPFLFDRPISFGASAYYFERLYNEYQERRVGTRLTLGHQIDRFWSVTGALRVENVSVSNVDPNAPTDLTSAQGSHFLVGTRASVTRDDRDSILRPTEGGLMEGSVEGVTGDYSFPVVNLEASRYFTTYQRPDGSGKHVLALRSQMSWAGANTPVFERFYAGGFNSIRGFQFRGVGPNTNGYMVGGDFMFLNSLEYQIPIKANDQFYLVAFIDSGTVESRISLKDYRVSAGVGARIIVPMLGPVPIALDFGFPVVRGPEDREQIFSFYVGLSR